MGSRGGLSFWILQRDWNAHLVCAVAHGWGNRPALAAAFGVLIFDSTEPAEHLCGCNAPLELFKSTGRGIEVDAVEVQIRFDNPIPLWGLGSPVVVFEQVAVFTLKTRL